MRGLPFEYAVRNLGRGPARLVLSVGGSALVVLLVLAAGGFVQGLRTALKTTGGAHNVLVLGVGSEDSVERSEIDASVPGILAASVSGIRTRAGAAYVSPEVHLMLPVSTAGGGGRNGMAMLRGVTPAAVLVHEPVALVEGRWPRAGADEVLVGRTVASVLGVAEEEVGVGRALMIDGRAWTIVGRFGAPGTTMESEIWMPLTDLMTATKRDSLSCVVVTLDPYDEETGEGAEFADIAAFTKTRPDLELAAMPEREYYANLAAFFGPIEAVAWVTASLIALGGLLGGLNTTYAAFASRIREIGTLQALGYSRRAVLWSMVEESTLATAAGGLLACAAGVLVLDGLAVRFSMGVFGLVIDARVVGLGLASGIALGVVGALPPAARCLRPPIPVSLKAV